MDKKIIEEFDRKEKANKLKYKNKKQHEGSKPKKTKLDEDNDDISSMYRDRAKERRDGLNKDFEHDPEDMKIFIGNSNYDDEDDIMDDEARRHQEIEDSKYLGGDVKHTHLVKGLDYALLQKIKTDNKQAQRLPNNVDFGSDSEEEDVIGNESGHIKGDSTEAINCRTALARRILNVLDEKWPSKSDLFEPGRMTYVVSLDDATVTTVVRSKAEQKL